MGRCIHQLLKLSMVIASYWRVSFLELYTADEVNDFTFYQSAICFQNYEMLYQFNPEASNFSSDGQALHVILTSDWLHLDEEALKTGHWLFPESFDLKSRPLRLNSQTYQYSFLPSGLIHIHEVYKVNENSFQNSFGIYDGAANLFHPSNLSLWERRKDLKGTQIKIVTRNSWDFHYTAEDGSFQGPLWEMFWVLQEKANFSTELMENKDGQYGIETENKTWTGMVGMLSRKEADIAIACLTINNARLKVIDYTVPVFRDKTTIISAARTKKEPNLLGYMDTFTIRSRIAIILANLLIALFLYGLFQVYSSKEPGITLIQALVMVGLAIIQLNHVHLKTFSNSKKMAYLTIFLFGTLLFTSYTALLTSTMIFSTELEPPIRTLQDIVDKKFTLLVMNGTREHLIFTSAREGSYLSHIHKKLIFNNPK